jgi:hypothetical protein
MKPELWIDAFDYGARIFSGVPDGRVSPTELGRVVSQLQRLLKPDVLVTPLKGLLSDLFRDKDSAESGDSFARDFEDAAASGALQRELERFTSVLGGLYLEGALAISIPGPANCLAELRTKDRNSAQEAVAAALVDVVRSLPHGSIRYLVIEESDSDAITLCEPVLHVAHHRAFKVALLGQPGVHFDFSFPTSTNLILGSDILEDSTFKSYSVQSAQRVYTRVPVTANPETVIAAFASLARMVAATE